MKFRDLPAAQFGRYGETIAARLLRNLGAGVIATFKFSGENDNEAPAIELSEKRIVLPDLDVSMRGRTLSVEIKTYAAPQRNRTHFCLVHGISTRLFDEYVASEAERGIPVHLGVLEVDSGSLLVSEEPISKITPRYSCQCDGNCESARLADCSFRKRWGNSYPQWYFRRDTLREWHRLEGQELKKLQAEHSKVSHAIKKHVERKPAPAPLFPEPAAPREPTEQDLIVAQFSGAPNPQHAALAAALCVKHGFSSLQKVVDADRLRPGKDLVDIIYAGYPLDRFEQFLETLRAEAST